MTSQTKMFLFTIEYVTIQKDLNIYRVNPLYLIFNEVNGYIEDINENKY